MGSVDEDEEVNDGMNDSSNGDNSSDQDTASEQAGVYDAGSEPAIQDKQEPPADEQRSKRIRKKQRGPKNDPTGKRKHRGRRGGKHAKAARAKRAEVPLDESLQGEIQGVANTLAEISAAAPHAMEHAEPGTDGDPVMQYITPSQFDGLDDIKRRSIYDERHQLLDVDPEFSARLHGTTPPVSWSNAWFPQERGGSDRARTSAAAEAVSEPSTSATTEVLAEDSLLSLPLWANRSLEARSEVVLSQSNFSEGIATASDALAHAHATLSPEQACAKVASAWAHVRCGDLKLATSWVKPLDVSASRRLVLVAEAGVRIWGNWLLNDESEGVVSGAGLLHEGLGEWLQVGESWRRPDTSDDALMVVKGGPWLFGSSALRAVDVDALQVVEWGKCQLMGCFVGGLSGDELCAQSACLVCGRASLFALNSTFEFTGASGGAGVSTYDRAEVALANSTLRANGYGVQMRHDSNVTLKHCVLYLNNMALLPIMRNPALSLYNTMVLGEHVWWQDSQIPSNYTSPVANGCKDYLRGKCRKTSATCRFVHDLAFATPIETAY